MTAEQLSRFFLQRTMKQQARRRRWQQRRSFVLRWVPLSISCASLIVSLMVAVFK